MRSLVGWAIAPMFVALILGLGIAADGRLHWDEPHYLYVGSYLTTSEILSGYIQSSGLANDFIFGRILHVLTVKALMALTGPGLAGYATVLTFHLLLIVASLYFSLRILRALLPGLATTGGAVLAIAMTPVIPYLCFKTMPDTQALAVSIFATWGLLRCSESATSRAALAWSLIAAAAMAVAILTKSQGVFMPAAFWAAAVVVPVAGIDRRRLMIFGALSGAAALLAAALLLEALGIGVLRYANGFAEAFVAELWWPFSTLYAATELGVLWLLLPIALFSQRRRALALFGLWFLISTVPFLYVFFSQVEPRHLTMNLVAAGGLFALALEVINLRWRAWRELPAAGKGAASLVAVVAVMASNWIALALMPHEADLGRLRALLHKLDERYGANAYTILAPWVLNEFHLLRVLDPQIDVRGVQIHVEKVKSAQPARRDLRDIYYRGRNVESVAELAQIRRPLVYVGTQEIAGYDVLRLLGQLAPEFSSQLAAKLLPSDHLYTAESAWLWRSPQLRLEPVAAVDYYHALSVTIRPPSNP